MTDPRTVRRRLAGLLTGAAVVAMRIAVRVLPTARIAVVHGYPDTEENSLRIAAELGRVLPPRWRVVLLCEDLTTVQRAFRITEPDGPTPRMVRRLSAHGFVLAAIARLWVHTHGLYGSPRGSRGRCHVLVGHGHGPKRAIPYGVAHRPQHADLAFTNAPGWGATIIADLGVPTTTPVVVAASPRADLTRADVTRAEARSPTSTAVDPLGMVRTILWLPTVRRTRSMLRQQWQDGTPVSDQDGMVAELERLRQLAGQHGLELATKVHALDADAEAFERFGIRVLTGDQLLAAGVTFHGLVRSAAGLLTDYSSVFVDHLRSPLPIAFWAADLAEFERDRGFNQPDFRVVAQALFLTDGGRMDDFLAHAAAGRTWQPAARRRLAEAIGLVADTDGATRVTVRRILDQLGPV